MSPQRHPVGGGVGAAKERPQEKVEAAGEAQLPGVRRRARRGALLVTCLLLVVIPPSVALAAQ